MSFYTRGELAAAHLTGRQRTRVGWFGRLILQVEVRHPKASYPVFTPPRPSEPHDPWRAGSFTFWRDARQDDMLPVVWGGAGDATNSH